MFGDTIKPALARHGHTRFDALDSRGRASKLRTNCQPITVSGHQACSSPANADGASPVTLSKHFTRLMEFNSPALPALNALVSRAERILNRWPDVVANPPEKDREALVQVMKARLEADDWTNARLSFVTSAARALFEDPERCERTELTALREFYFNEIRASTSQGFLGALFSIYMSSFVEGAAHPRELANALSTAKARLGARWQQLIEKVPEILDARIAASALASRMSGMATPWIGLKEIGVRNPHGPGIMNAAHLAYIKQIEPRLGSRLEVERLLDWLKPEGVEAKRTGAGEALSAMLGHWTRSDPPQDYLKYLTESFVGMYGDPRVLKGGVWSAVPEERMAVILRWLTGENIRFFLDVVSAVEDSHMWEPRRNFWLGLHTKGRIDAAWVALSDKGVLEARRRSAATGQRGTLSYGRQVAGGGRANTSLLILKIGRKIVVEGSHSYKVHIFDISNTKAPKLYEPRYDCEDIRLINGSLAQSHLGYWQGWVLEHI
jgi:hypothetical protein